MAMDRARDLYDRLVAGGEPVIDELILARESETYFLDFKRSSNQGDGPRLSVNDRNNLAKAISSFGNSEGGVIVWGVDCSQTAGEGDVAQAKVPLANAVRFRSWLEGVVSGCTVPAHESVVSHAITSTGPQGFVVTYIPKSLRAPHQMVRDLRYYMRAGSAFSGVPHGLLEGMFGRRPQPHVFPQYVLQPPSAVKHCVSISCGISVLNGGLAMARDIYVVVTFLSEPGPKCRIVTNLPDQANWTASEQFGVRMSLVSNDGYKLPPDTYVQPIVLNFDFLGPFDADLKVQFLVGCDGGLPYRGEWLQSGDDIESAVESILNGTLTGYAAASSLLPIPFDDDDRANVGSG